jgi:hypothetical protein
MINIQDEVQDTKEMVTENFSLLKHFCKIENFNTTNKFDVVYFDVFGYDFQSELWSAMKQTTSSLYKLAGMSIGLSIFLVFLIRQNYPCTGRRP